MHKHELSAVRWRSCQANPVATFQVPTSAAARACADGERVNSISVTRMDSRTDAVGLCAKAIMITNAPEKIASSLEATCIGIRCGAIWLHSTVMQLRFCARARLGACARLAAVVAAARLLVPCAHTVADARTVSDEVSRGIWFTDVRTTAAAAACLPMSRADTVANAWAASEVPIVDLWRREGQRHEQGVIVIVREPAMHWLVVGMRSHWLAPRAGVSAGIVQGAVPHGPEELDLEIGRERVRVNGVAGFVRVSRNAAGTHPTWWRVEPFQLPTRWQSHEAAKAISSTQPAVAASTASSAAPPR